MFLTKEGDYGIRIIRALASGEMKTVDAICACELIPGQYAYKILKKLERAGLVRSIRGRNGGYRLIKQLDKFNLYDIISAIDEQLFLNQCLKQDIECPRNNHDAPCAVHIEFEHLQKVLIDEMQKKNIVQVMQNTPST